LSLHDAWFRPFNLRWVKTYTFAIVTTSLPGRLGLPITHKYSQLVSGGLREKPRQSICRTAYPCHMS
jgi:hypothetical protein